MTAAPTPAPVDPIDHLSRAKQRLASVRPLVERLLLGSERDMVLSQLDACAEDLQAAIDDAADAPFREKILRREFSRLRELCERHGIDYGSKRLVDAIDDALGGKGAA